MQEHMCHTDVKVGGVRVTIIKGPLIIHGVQHPPSIRPHLLPLLTPLLLPAICLALHIGGQANQARKDCRRQPEPEAIVSGDCSNTLASLAL